jgi:hypothetical protein
MGRQTRQKRRTQMQNEKDSTIPSYSRSETPAEDTDDGLYYVVCAIMPWSSLQITGPFEGKISHMVDDSCPVGFMPVFKTREDAERFKADAGNGPACQGEIMMMVREAKL